MINEISRILIKFRPCFSRKAAFDWFVIVIVGFIVRLDHHGVSSFVRWLYIKPSLYTSLLSFFRSSSWQLQNVMKTWWQIVLSHCPLIYIDERLVLAGDGSITNLLKWFSPIKLFIFERKPRNRVSGVRFQVSVVRNELADT